VRGIDINGDGTPDVASLLIVFVCVWNRSFTITQQQQAKLSHRFLFPVCALRIFRRAVSTSTAEIHTT